MSIIDTKTADKLIVANISGFFGDRFSAAKEMVEGGPVDVLTGDYLAELTMAILFKQTFKDPNRGYAYTFLKQMEQVMGNCLDKNIKVVSNAGGLNPKSLATELQKVAETLGLHPKIAYIDGDNLMPRLVELQEQGEEFIHMDTGVPLNQAKAQPMTANAYLGGWGVAKALEEGADIVVGGRLADAAVVMGPAAWRFGWKRDDWDALAGAAVAGHIIECSGQACGGNYSFIEEVPSYHNIGFPIAEMFADGSSVITKHPGTGGLVSVGTVTAQLLYETRQPTYLTPDVAARFDTIQISQQAQDRVEIKGIRGEPTPVTTKVCINNLGGHMNSMTLLLAGLDNEKKAKIVEDTIFTSLGGKEQFEETDFQLIRSDKDNPPCNEEAFAYMKISVVDSDPKKVASIAKTFVESGLCTVPGLAMTTPPGKGRPIIRHWPTLIPQEKVTQRMVIGEKEFLIDATQADQGVTIPDPEKIVFPEVPGGKTEKVPLGRIFAARSGDKGGNANLGIWGKSSESYAFLSSFLTTEKLKEIMPDMADFEIERYELPNLLALNFYIKGLLGDGVSASVRMDPQAKALGEYLRAKHVDIPTSLLQ